MSKYQNDQIQKFILIVIIIMTKKQNIILIKYEIIKLFGYINSYKSTWKNLKYFTRAILSVKKHIKINIINLTIELYFE